MKRLLILLLMAVLTKSTFATLQSPNRVIVENEIYLSYLDLFKNHIRRDSILKIAYKQINDLERIANPEADEYESRQVYGIWEIIENKVFLIKMTDGLYDVDLYELFEKNEPKEKVFADWLTDTVYASKGNVLAHGIRPVREYEIELVIANGEVLNRTNYNNSILRESCFAINNEFIYQNIDWESITDFNDKTIMVHVGLQPKMNGKLDFISNDYSFAIDNLELITDQENPFIKEAIRIAHLIPEWDVVIQRNKILVQQLIITFDKQLKEKYAR